MSVQFSSYILQPYRGALNGVPVKLGTTYNAQGGTTFQAQVIYASLDFANVYTSGACTINLQSQGTVNPIDKILMMHVDNTNNNNAIYIYFPDTQDTISIPFNSIGYFPVITNGLVVNIYNGAGPGANGVTNITFCNFCLPAFESNATQNIVAIQGVASNTPGGTTAIALDYFVIGDLAQTVSVSLSSIGTSANLFNAPYTSGRIVLTSYEAWVLANYNTSPLEMLVELVDLTNTIYNLWQFMAMPDIDNNYKGFKVGGRSNIFENLDATKTYNIKNTVAASSGIFQFTYNYTWTANGSV